MWLTDVPYWLPLAKSRLPSPCLFPRGPPMICWLPFLQLSFSSNIMPFALWPLLSVWPYLFNCQGPHLPFGNLQFPLIKCSVKVWDLWGWIIHICSLCAENKKSLALPVTPRWGEMSMKILQTECWRYCCPGKIVVKMLKNGTRADPGFVWAKAYKVWGFL